MIKWKNDRVKGMLQTDGRKMRNGDGEEVILRGWGAGNWMNPEGFMLGIGTGYMGTSMSPGLALPGRFQSARTMDQTIRELCGSDYAKNFWPQWYENHLGESDIRAMAELGYNSVRLPLTAWMFMPEEPVITFNEGVFSMLDRVLDWCETYRVYAILDMHAAPGGHSGLCCDDGLDNTPRIFFEPESRERTLILWEEIAKRYADRWIVGGYDLLNEPISTPRWHHLMPELSRFYDDVIARIRRHDHAHIVFLEGVTFSTNMSIFHRAYDAEINNWAIAIHLYGFSPEIRDLYKFLEVAHRLDVPVWIGEGRGNSNEDMAVFYDIAARHEMGYNLWSWKSVINDEKSGAVAYALPEGFDAVIRYATEGGPRPSYQASQALFDALLDAIRYDNCMKDEEVHRYCLRVPGLSLPAAGYDGGAVNSSFSGGWTLGNPLAYRTEDGTKLVLRKGVQVPDSIKLPGSPATKPDPLNSLWLELSEGAFACYTVYGVDSPCSVRISAFSQTGGVLRVTDGDEEETLQIDAGENVSEYSAITMQPGEERIVRIEAVRGVLRIEEIGFRV